MSNFNVYMSHLLKMLFSVAHSLKWGLGSCILTSFPDDSDAVVQGALFGKCYFKSLPLAFRKCTSFK